MLKYLLDRFKQAPGPFKQTRLIAGDLAEEIVDLAEYYAKRIRNQSEHGSASQGNSPQGSCVKNESRSSAAELKNDLFTAQKELELSTKETDKKNTGPVRTLDVPEEFAKALDFPQNKKTQEFKVLAILWDAQQRNIGTLSAKAVSEHGVKLGLTIRHENARKVIRMRLNKQVEIHTEQIGSGSVYKYQISPVGSEYFVSKYLH